MLVRDLLRLGWSFRTNRDKFELVPPTNYEKEIIKEGMSFTRDATITGNRQWIEKHIDIGRKNLTTGFNALKSEIKPIIEVCNTQKQKDLFRLYRYYWSSPASEYVGRRIRILIRDDGLPEKPVIGIAAIGSSIIHIPDRDKWIGWNIKTRTKHIIYMMDAYIIGALPPYNDLLGGKLITYILASDELRKIYHKKYTKSETIISGRKRISDLALIMTTSLYGLNSSQYNRLKYKNSLLCKPIGITSGFGTLHITNETFMAMRELVESKGFKISHQFGMGPNWRMRVIRTACDLLNLDSDIILKHSFKRGIYAIPLMINWKSFLNGKTRKPIYRNLPLQSLTKHWQERWLSMRKSNNEILKRVAQFTPEQFVI
ncbi:MAG: Druantia anti-phage system protein DruA [Phycisphaerae bacterium]